MDIRTLLEEVKVLRPNEHQKYVLLVIETSETPVLAYDRVMVGESNIEAAKILNTYGYIRISNSAKRAELTLRGKKSLISYGLVDSSGEVTDVGQEILKRYSD